MRSVSVRLADLENIKINLGYVGENEHVHILFDCKKAFDQYPNAVPSLTVVPPKGDSYPAVVTREGDIVEWVVTDSDLIYHGNGKIQLQFEQNEVVMKSAEARTFIAPSSIPTGTIPTPIQNWIAQANAILAEIPEDINSALAAAKASGEFDGDDGVGIASIAKTGTSGLVDTYTITLTDGNHYDIDVTNGTPGQNGVGIQNIAKTSTVGLVDTYTITLTNGQTYPFTVTNGQNGVEIDDTTPAVNKVFSSSKVDEELTGVKNDIQGLDDEINATSGTATVSVVAGLNHKSTETVYKSQGSNYQTHYFSVTKGIQYTITLSRLPNQSVTTNVRLCFGANIPANNVEGEFIETVAVNALSVTHEYTAPNDGYVGLSSYVEENAEGITSVVVSYGSSGLAEQVDELKSEMYGQVNSVSLWQEGYYGATEGGYTPKTSSNPLCCMIDGILPAVEMITCDSTLKMRLHGWDGNGVYKGTWTGSTFSTVSGSNIAYFTSLDISAIRQGRETYTFKLCIANATDQTTDVPIADTILVVMSANRVDYANAQSAVVLQTARDFEKKTEIGTNYVVDSNFMKRGVAVTEIGNIEGAQAFCEYNGKYYSVYADHLFRQSATFVTEADESVSIGHGNAIVRGNSKYAYISGWNDDTVHVADLDTMTIVDTITLPITGYTTAAVDEANKIMYIFSRSDTTSTVDFWGFTVWDYDNDQVLLTKKTPFAFAAIQGVDFYNGRILVAWGLGSVQIPSGLAVFDTDCNMLCEYKLPMLRSNEAEGFTYDRTNDRLMFSTINQKVYTIEQKI